jgi:hypothetical protein
MHASTVTRTHDSIFKRAKELRALDRTAIVLSYPVQLPK